jgi:Protein of unknown function (DUF3105)
VTNTGQDDPRGRRRLLAAGALIAAVALAATVAALAGANPSRPTAATASAARTGALAEVVTFTEEANHVTTPVTYPQTPPAGGNHSPVWINCGIYPTPVPNENAVHDLEHGAVWITYVPTLPAADVATLARYVRSQDADDPDPHVLLSPYPGLPAPVVVSAWATQLRLTGADDPRLPLFVTTYLRGAQAPEANETCSGGIGTPDK